MNHISKNKYLLSLFCIVSGFLLSVFPILYSTSFTIFFPGILLLIVPIICLLISVNDNIPKYDELFLLILILISIAYNHYIFAFKFNYPIGTDAPVQIDVTRSFLVESGHYLLAPMNCVSFGFPGLYILYTFLMDVTGFDLYPLATYLHPALNMLTLVFFYIFVKKFFDAKISLLSVFLFGWDLTVIKFGFEYRTQSLAIILYMAIISLCSMRIATKNEGYNVSSAVTLMLLAVGMTQMHLVTNMTLFLTLLILFASSLIISKIGGKIDVKISSTFFLFSLIIFLFYMLYLANFFDTIIGFIKYCVIQSFSNEFMGSSSNTRGLKGSLYGPLVLTVTWITRLIFILSSILFAKKFAIDKIKKVSDLFIILWAGVFIALMLLISFKGNILNPDRLYHFFAFPYSIIMSFGIVYFLRIKSLKLRPYIKVVTLIFILLFVISSLLKLPSSIIGDTEPLRGHCLVDDQHWDMSKNNYGSNEILTQDAVSKNKIYCDSNLKDGG